MKILITGGAGYIGSHTLVELNNADYSFVVYDNFSNSSKESLKRVKKIIGKKVDFVKGDIRNKKSLEKVFKKYQIDSVIHLAGVKAVGESIEKSLKYYDNNVNGILVLLKVMKKYNCKKIVFSSSATVYGNPSSNPIDETFPVGAHKSGMIGEDPTGIPNNLMAYISQVLVGKREFLNIFGGDYDTFDGTGVRDYIHVVDLANAHVKAIDYLNSLNNNTKPLIVNIGTGIGYSVLDMVKAFEKVSNKNIPYEIVSRRSGDIATCFANPAKAKKILGWEAKKSIEDMCADSWNWQSSNPHGYKR